VLSGNLIRAVGFDVYGVMTVSPYDEMERYAVADGVPPGAMTAAFTTPRWLEEVQRGTVTVAAYIDEVAAELHQLHGVQLNPGTIATCLETSLTAVPAMVELVGAVRKTCRVGLLTNNVRQSPLWAPMLNEDVFDVIVDATSGFRKPDKGAYTALVDALGVPASAVVFVDDSQGNLTPARELGIHTVLFSDPRHCREELRSLGIDVAAPGKVKVPPCPH
jgi:putative hydrolase of the HAD superfamily